MTYTETNIDNMIRLIVSEVGLKYTEDYDIRKYYKGGKFSKKTLGNVLDKMQHNILFNLDSNDLTLVLRTFDKMVFKFLNDMYNIYGFGYNRYMAFIPTPDIYEITANKSLIAAKDLLKRDPSPLNVKNVYDTLARIIREEIPHTNQVRTAYITESFNIKQGNQCLGLRGFGNDIQGDIFSTVIPESYAESLTDMRSSAVESRGVVTALHYSSQSIRDAESFAKSTQIVSEFVTTLVKTDCGSQVGIKRYIRPPGMNEHGDNYGGDLQFLKGQMYKLKESDSWGLLTDDSTHVYGKDIIIRTTVSCQLENNKHVCIACFGRHGYTKHEEFNLGQWSCTKVNEPAVQSLLSAKHFIVSADGGTFVLDKELSRYIKVVDNGLTLTKFYKRFDKVILSVDYNQSLGLKDINSINDVIRVNPERVSRIKKLKITLTDKKGKEEVVTIDIGKVNKSAVFSTEFLKYIVTNGKQFTDDAYHIDILSWDYRKSFMFIPNHVFNYNQLVENLKGLMGSGRSLNGEKIESLERLINETFDLYNTKLSLHICHLATVIYSLAIKNKSQHNYMMQRGLDAEVGTIDTITKYRSFTTLASTGTLSNMLAIHNIESNNKEPHVLDILVDPEAYLDSYG